MLCCEIYHVHHKSVCSEKLVVTLVAFVEHFQPQCLGVLSQRFSLFQEISCNVGCIYLGRFFPRIVPSWSVVTKVFSEMIGFMLLQLLGISRCVLGCCHALL